MNPCSFCGLPVYLPGVAEHPCCTFARERGERECGGCRAFAERDRPKRKAAA